LTLPLKCYLTVILHITSKSYFTGKNNFDDDGHLFSKIGPGAPAQCSFGRAVMENATLFREHLSQNLGNQGICNAAGSSGPFEIHGGKRRTQMVNGRTGDF